MQAYTLVHEHAEECTDSELLNSVSMLVILYRPWMQRHVHRRWHWDYDASRHALSCWCDAAQTLTLSTQQCLALATPTPHCAACPPACLPVPPMNLQTDTNRIHKLRFFSFYKYCISKHAVNVASNWDNIWAMMMSWDNGEDYQDCFMSYGVPQLCSYRHAHMNSSYNWTTACWSQFLCVFLNYSQFVIWLFLCISVAYFFSFAVSLAVSNNATGCLVRLVSEMTRNVYSETIHSTNSLTASVNICEFKIETNFAAENLVLPKHQQVLVSDRHWYQMSAYLL